MCVIAYWSHYTSFSIIALHITAKMETFKAGLKYIVNRKDGVFLQLLRKSLFINVTWGSRVLFII